MGVSIYFLAIHISTTSSKAWLIDEQERVVAVAADEVVQFYLKALDGKLTAPLNQLIGFQRVHLEPGQSQTVTVTIKPEMLMLFDENGQQVFFR